MQTTANPPLMVQFFTESWVNEDTDRGTEKVCIMRISIVFTFFLKKGGKKYDNHL